MDKLYTYLAASFIISVLSANDAVACETGTREIVHEWGVDCIPNNPQRIVTLSDQNALLPLLELGVVPVASTGSLAPDGTHFFQRTEGFDTSDVAFIGLSQPYDFEAIAAQEPDLILVPSYFDNAYEPLSQIAPTVSLETNGFELEETLRTYAEIVNRVERYEELRSTFYARAAEVREAVGDRVQDTTVSVLNYWNNTLYPLHEHHVAKIVFDALGLVRPDAQENLGLGRDLISFERLGDHIGDVMVVITFDMRDGRSADAEAFASHPLVRTLPAVRADQLFFADGQRLVGSGWTIATRGIEFYGELLLNEGLDINIVQEAE